MRPHLRLPRGAGARPGHYTRRRRSRPGAARSARIRQLFPADARSRQRGLLWASLLFRTTSTLVIFSVIAVRRPALSIEGRQLPPLALVGIGDMLGNLFFAAASTTGLVSVTSVLASLYPIVTVIMARLVLHERVARSQESGIALTLAGVALISAG